MGTRMHISRRRAIVAGRGATAAVVATVAGLQTISKKSDYRNDYDVVVAGGGVAGFAAALSAAEAGARVAVLEKLPALANAYFDARNMAVVDPLRETPLGIPDSLERHYRDTLDAAGPTADPALVRIMVEEAPTALLWIERLGMVFSPTLINSGSHWPRSHVPIGPGYVQVLSKAAARAGVDTFFSRDVVEIRRGKGGRAESVVARTEGGTLERWIPKKALVLAGGGFGSNHEMISRFAPAKARFESANEAGSSGELLLAAERAGAALVDMDAVEVVPRSNPKAGIQAYLHINNARYIVVNSLGKRFVAEDAHRNKIAEAFSRQPGEFAFEIGDDRTVKSYSMLMQADLWKAIEIGEAFKADTVEELAHKIGVPVASLRRTVDAYNRSVRTKRDPLGKLPINLSHELRQPPFWAARVQQRIHLTPGGLRINTEARVLDQFGRPIPALFAAGEITGGIHGRNSLGGDSVTDALVFGMIAGTNAAREKV